MATSSIGVQASEGGSPWILQMMMHPPGCPTFVTTDKNPICHGQSQQLLGLGEYGCLSHKKLHSHFFIHADLMSVLNYNIADCVDNIRILVDLQAYCIPVQSSHPSPEVSPGISLHIPYVKNSACSYTLQQFPQKVSLCTSECIFLSCRPCTCNYSFGVSVCFPGSRQDFHCLHPLMSACNTSSTLSAMSFQFSFLVCIVCANPISPSLFHIVGKCGSQRQRPSIHLCLVYNLLHPRVINGQVCYIASFIYIINHILYAFVYGPLSSLYSIQFSTIRTIERSHPLHFAALQALDAIFSFLELPTYIYKDGVEGHRKTVGKQLPCSSLTCLFELFLRCAIHGLPWPAT